jgi:hypothetical protein
LIECGEPTSKEVVGDQTSGIYVARPVPKGRELDGSGRTVRRGKDQDYIIERYGQKTEVVEKWTYNCGRHDFLYVLTFIGGDLSNIQSHGYGSGESDDCKGAELRKMLAPAKPPPEPAPAPEESKFGTITVYGQPYFAKVYVDGQVAGEMVCTIEKMPVGAHQVVVMKEGYKEWQARIIVEPGKTTFLEVYLLRE